MKHISQKELDVTLEQHKLWLKSAGRKGKRANLNGAHLTNVSLTGAYLSVDTVKAANLTETTLIWAILHKD